MQVLKITFDYFRKPISPFSIFLKMLTAFWFSTPLTVINVIWIKLMHLIIGGLAGAIKDFLAGEN